MYHEVLEICNVYSELTEVKCRHIEVELPLHRELHGTINNIQINEAVAKVVWLTKQFLLSAYCKINQFCTISQQALVFF